MKLSNWIKILQTAITIVTQIIRALRLLDNDNDKHKIPAD